ncbi:PAB-dependent poly(A)-specific ribonuclease subunit pan-3 [Neurospora crassa]|nr:PAB-dependent poly(A)-specific ribonuclease subunit pan-3 [Neurospora crassa]
MAATRYNSGDLRRQVGSPRAKNRDTKETLCRNVVIYGHCRWEDSGCTFNHDQNKASGSQTDLNSNRRVFNVESPSFTPANQQQSAGKKSTFSSQAASAAPFTPRGVGTSTPTLQQANDSTIFNPAAIREFTPQNYDVGNTISQNGAQHVTQDGGLYSDPFSISSLGQTMPPAGQYNPYANDPNNLAGAGAGLYQPAGFGNGLVHPPNYHLYQPPSELYRPSLQPYQRTTYDFFIPKDRRENLQKKLFHMQQLLPNSGLPNLDRWHSLFPLDTKATRNSTCFGYPSWMYKAQNNKNGRHFALRRIEGYRLTNEKAILNVTKEWKKIINANIVTVHEAFTTEFFGDSSLIFVYDFHPLSETLYDHHFPPNNSHNRLRNTNKISENLLWSYVCQIANALLAIHNAKLAARCLELSKIIWENNRIRLAACSILDVLHHDSPNRKTIEELQQEDFVKFGRIILALATNTPTLNFNNIDAALATIVPRYSTQLRGVLEWLIKPSAPGETKTVETLLGGITTHLANFANFVMQESDEKEFHLMRELENGRIARLMFKLSVVNERGDSCGVHNWSETGERLLLKLFRDYVFHQVDADGKARLDTNHYLNCLSKLDASSEEQILLTSRDNATVFVVSYRSIRQMLDRAYGELGKESKPSATGATI